MITRYMPSSCICLSVTSRCSTETAKRRIMTQTTQNNARVYPIERPPLFAARLPWCCASRGFVRDSWYLYQQLLSRVWCLFCVKTKSRDFHDIIAQAVPFFLSTKYVTADTACGIHLTRGAKWKGYEKVAICYKEATTSRRPCKTEKKFSKPLIGSHT